MILPSKTNHSFYFSMKISTVILFKPIFLIFSISWMNMPHGSGLSALAINNVGDNMYHVYNVNNKPFGGIIYGQRAYEAYAIPLHPYHREPAVEQRGIIYTQPNN